MKEIQIELLRIAKSVCSLESRTINSGKFSITDEMNLNELEIQAVASALDLVAKKLSQNGLGKFAYGKVIINEFNEDFAARYRKASDDILLNAKILLDRSGKIPRFMALAPLYHEIGHRVFEKAPSQWQSWYEMEFSLAGKKSISPYGQRNFKEDFAEIFRFTAMDRPPQDSSMLDRFNTIINKSR